MKGKKKWKKAIRKERTRRNVRKERTNYVRKERNM